MLLWFVSKSEINSALAGSLIEEEEVECRPEKISNAVLDENVDINLIRRFFTEDAWKVVEDVIMLKARRTQILGLARYVIMIFMNLVNSQFFVKGASNGTILNVWE